MKKKEFLNSDVSGPEIDGQHSFYIGFTRYLKKFERGQLVPSKMIRQRPPKFPEVEQKLVAYIRAQRQESRNDNRGVTWEHLIEKCKQWSATMDDDKYRSFKASPGFIDKCLRRHGLTGFNRRGGEAEEIDDENNGEAAINQELASQIRDELETTEEDHEDSLTTGRANGSPPVLTFSDASRMISQLSTFAEGKGLPQEERFLLTCFAQALCRHQASESR